MSNETNAHHHRKLGPNNFHVLINACGNDIGDAIRTDLTNHEGHGFQISPFGKLYVFDQQNRDVTIRCRRDPRYNDAFEYSPEAPNQVLFSMREEWQDFHYFLEVPKGHRNYGIKFYWADWWYDSPGSRRFQVDLDLIKILPTPDHGLGENLDIYALAGPNLYTLEGELTASGEGTMLLSFRGKWPFVNAVEIWDI